MRRILLLFSTFTLVCVGVLILTCSRPQTAEALIAEGLRHWRAGAGLPSAMPAAEARARGVRFERARAAFAEAVALEPENAEAHYLLACTLDAIDAIERAAPARSLEATLAVSTHLERAVPREAPYTGMVIGMGAPSRLTLLWGRLAEGYCARGDADSARWALREGHARGGFPSWALSDCRSLLAACDSGAILFVDRTEQLYPIWYLQSIDSVRRDLTIVDHSLLGSAWYVRALHVAGIVAPTPLRMDAPIGADRGRSIAAGSFTDRHAYTLPAPNGGGAITFYAHGTDLAGNRWLLPADTAVVYLLRQNRWVRPVYFAGSVGAELLDRLGLDSSLRNVGFAHLLRPEHAPAGRLQIAYDRCDSALAAEPLHCDIGAWGASIAVNDPDAAAAALRHVLVFIGTARAHFLVTKDSARSAHALQRLAATFPVDRFAPAYARLLDPDPDWLESLYAHAGMHAEFLRVRRQIRPQPTAIRNPTDL